MMELRLPAPANSDTAGRSSARCVTGELESFSSAPATTVPRRDQHPSLTSTQAATTLSSAKNASRTLCSASERCDRLDIMQFSTRFLRTPDAVDLSAGGELQERLEMVRSVVKEAAKIVESAKDGSVMLAASHERRRALIKEEVSKMIAFVARNYNVVEELQSVVGSALEIAELPLYHTDRRSDDPFERHEIPPLIGVGDLERANAEMAARAVQERAKRPNAPEPQQNKSGRRAASNLDELMWLLESVGEDVPLNDRQCETSTTSGVKEETLRRPASKPRRLSAVSSTGSEVGRKRSTPTAELPCTSEAFHPTEEMEESIIDFSLGSDSLPITSEEAANLKLLKFMHDALSRNSNEDEANDSWGYSEAATFGTTLVSSFGRPCATKTERGSVRRTGGYGASGYQLLEPMGVDSVYQELTFVMGQAQSSLQDDSRLLETDEPLDESFPPAELMPQLISAAPSRLILEPLDDKLLNILRDLYSRYDYHQYFRELRSTNVTKVKTDGEYELEIENLIAQRKVEKQRRAAGKSKKELGFKTGRVRNSDTFVSNTSQCGSDDSNVNHVSEDRSSLSSFPTVPTPSKAQELYSFGSKIFSMASNEGIIHAISLKNGISLVVKGQKEVPGSVSSGGGGSSARMTEKTSAESSRVSKKAKDRGVLDCIKGIDDIEVSEVCDNYSVVICNQSTEEQSAKISIDRSKHRGWKLNTMGDYNVHHGFVVVSTKPGKTQTLFLLTPEKGKIPIDFARLFTIEAEDAKGAKTTATGEQTKGRPSLTDGGSGNGGPRRLSILQMLKVGEHAGTKPRKTKPKGASRKKPQDTAVRHAKGAKGGGEGDTTSGSPVASDSREREELDGAEKRPDPQNLESFPEDGAHDRSLLPGLPDGDKAEQDRAGVDGIKADLQGGNQAMLEFPPLTAGVMEVEGKKGGVPSLDVEKKGASAVSADGTRAHRTADGGHGLVGHVLPTGTAPVDHWGVPLSNVEDEAFEKNCVALTILQGSMWAEEDTPRAKGDLTGAERRPGRALLEGGVEESGVPAQEHAERMDHPTPRGAGGAPSSGSMRETSMDDLMEEEMVERMLQAPFASGTQTLPCGQHVDENSAEGMAAAYLKRIAAEERLVAGDGHVPGQVPPLTDLYDGAGTEVVGSLPSEGQLKGRELPRGAAGGVVVASGRKVQEGGRRGEHAHSGSADVRDDGGAANELHGPGDAGLDVGASECGLRALKRKDVDGKEGGVSVPHEGFHPTSSNSAATPSAGGAVHASREVRRDKGRGGTDQPPLQETGATEGGLRRRRERPGLSGSKQSSARATGSRSAQSGAAAGRDKTAAARAEGIRTQVAAAAKQSEPLTAHPLGPQDRCSDATQRSDLPTAELAPVVSGRSEDDAKHVGPSTAATPAERYHSASGFGDTSPFCGVSDLQTPHGGTSPGIPPSAVSSLVRLGDIRSSPMTPSLFQASVNGVNNSLLEQLMDQVKVSGKKVENAPEGFKIRKTEEYNLLLNSGGTATGAVSGPQCRLFKERREVCAGVKSHGRIVLCVPDDLFDGAQQSSAVKNRIYGRMSSLSRSLASKGKAETIVESLRDDLRRVAMKCYTRSKKSLMHAEGTAIPKNDRSRNGSYNSNYAASSGITSLPLLYAPDVVEEVKDIELAGEEARDLFIRDPARYDCVIDDIIRRATQRVNDEDFLSSHPSAKRSLTMKFTDSMVGKRDSGAQSRRYRSVSTSRNKNWTGRVSEDSLEKESVQSHSMQWSASRVSSANTAPSSNVLMLRVTDNFQRLLDEQCRAKRIIAYILMEMRRMWRLRRLEGDIALRAAVDRYVFRSLAFTWRIERRRVLNLHKLINLLDRQTGRVKGWIPFYSKDNVLIDRYVWEPVPPELSHRMNVVRHAMCLARRHQLVPLHSVRNFSQMEPSSHHLMFGYTRRLVGPMMKVPLQRRRERRARRAAPFQRPLKTFSPQKERDIGTPVK